MYEIIQTTLIAVQHSSNSVLDITYIAVSGFPSTETAVLAGLYFLTVNAR